jgi:hypothetical protein
LRVRSHLGLRPVSRTRFLRSAVARSGRWRPAPNGIFDNISEAVGLRHGLAPEQSNRLVVNPEGVLDGTRLHMNY